MAKRARTSRPVTRSKSRGSKPATGGLKAYCRSLPGVTEDVKWGKDLCFSVGRKLFAGFDLDSEANFSFKCTEQDQLALIQRDGIIPAPYVAKHGWVSVQRKGALPAAEARRFLRKSYELVLAGLPKRAQSEIRAE